MFSSCVRLRFSAEDNDTVLLSVHLLYMIVGDGIREADVLQSVKSEETHRE